MGMRLVPPSAAGGKALRDLRLARHWSQRDLADRLETTEQTVGRWERGVVIPSSYHWNKLCQLFGLSQEQLRQLITTAGQIQEVEEEASPKEEVADLPSPASMQGSDLKVATAKGVEFLPGMSRHRVLLRHMVILFILVGVLVLSASALLTTSAANVSPMTQQQAGMIAFGSSEHFAGNSAQGMNDEVSIRLDIPAPRTGTSYYAWMAGGGSGSETEWRLLGRLTERNGVASLQYAEPAHENLLLSYSRFLITTEESSVPPLQPSSESLYWASVSTTPTPGDPNHYSLLDHLRHLLAYDPTLSALGIHGGLDYWLVRNTHEVQAESSGLVTDWQARNVSDLHAHLIRILDYLDGSPAVSSEVRGASPLLVAFPSARVGLLSLVSNEEPEGYVLHTDVHLQGVAQAVGASAFQQQQARRIRVAMNALNRALTQVRQDTLQLLRMDDAHLMQLAALRVLTDLAHAATLAVSGQPSASGLAPSGLGSIDESIERLATFSWQRV